MRSHSIAASLLHALSAAVAGLLVMASPALAQSSAVCRDCPLPKEEQWSDCLQDSTLSLTFKENHPAINGVRSIKRETILRFGRPEQALKVQYMLDGVCRDTLVLVTAADRLKAVNLGLCGNPMGAPIFPAREFHREQGMKEPPMNFLEISGTVGYAGKDESLRQTGFDGVLPGAQLLLGRAIGENLHVAVGGGVMFEEGRMRIPVLGDIRWTFLGGSRVEEYFEYVPSACQFGEPGNEAVAPDDEEGVVEVPTSAPTDPTVYFYQDRRRVEEGFRPFLYAEGGVIFNGKFEGAGPSPAINSDDYGQYLLGGGLGVPFLGFMNARIGYRYLRLNLRTPCPACEDELIVNTNTVHSVNVALGVNLGF